MALALLAVVVLLLRLLATYYLYDFTAGAGARLADNLTRYRYTNELYYTVYSQIAESRRKMELSGLWSGLRAGCPCFH